MHAFVCLWLGLGGAIFLFGGLREFLKQRAFASAAVPVNVIVSEVRTERDGEGSDVYRAVFTIIDGKNAGLARDSRLSSYPAAHTKGDAARGLYDPAGDRIESLSSHRKLLVLCALLSLFGAGFLGFAIFLYLRGY